MLTIEVGQQYDVADPSGAVRRYVVDHVGTKPLMGGLRIRMRDLATGKLRQYPAYQIKRGTFAKLVSP